MSFLMGPIPEGESAAPFVPRIDVENPVSHVQSQTDFFPGTRSSRRAFSVLAAAEPVVYKEGPDLDFAVIGATLGRALVARFAPTMLRYHEAVSAVENTVELPTGLSVAFDDPCPIALFRAIRGFYAKEACDLHLMVFTEYEISITKKGFLDFTQLRDQWFQEFRRTEPDWVVVIQEITSLMMADDSPVAFWVIRDFVLQTELGTRIPELMAAVWPVYACISAEIESKTALSSIAPYVGLLASLVACEKTARNRQIAYDFSRFASEAFLKLLPLFRYSTPTTLGLSGGLSFFEFAKLHPQSYSCVLSLSGKVTTPFLAFLLQAQQYESCLLPLVDLLTENFALMDEESAMWTTAVLFCTFMIEAARVVVRSDTVICCMKLLCAILMHRPAFAVQHFVNLNVLAHLASYCELEEHIDTEGPASQRSAANPSSGGAVSYLDIPRLSFGGGPLKLNLENPKLQLHFLPTGQTPAFAYTLTQRDYLQQRRKRMVYVSDAVHTQFILLMFSLIIHPRLHRLDTVFCDPFPQVNRKPNVLFTLMKHLDTNHNDSVVMELDRLLRDRPTPWEKDYHRLLRLLVPTLFSQEKYTGGQHVASGAFGAVLAVPAGDEIVAVKTLEKSRFASDNPHLVSVYTEVSILEQCVGDRRVTQLLDYGCTADSYYIVMEFYSATLKSWRRKVTSVEPRIFLRLYREFLQCCTVLTEKKVNHFDIKCDNVMLDMDGYPALADFGESISYDDEYNCYTRLNKGTEWIKSPEMLSIALNSATTNANYDRRQRVGAGPESDVWSIGCLFFELLTGSFLFVDPDWSRFFLRITTQNTPLLTPENTAMISNDKFCQFLEFVLQRSVRHRPNLSEVIVRFDEMFPAVRNGELPHLSMPVFGSAGSLNSLDGSERVFLSSDRETDPAPSNDSEEEGG
jgi:serine/threonine protein kinase